MKSKNLIDICLIGLFAALCYVSLMLFFFPVGPMFIHFGNLLVVLAALLIGGWQGGLAGSIGMGLYDLLNGHADSSPKTFLLKFLIGLTVGLVYTWLKRKFSSKTASAIIGAVCGMLVNLIGEIAWKTVQYMVMGMKLPLAFNTSVLAQASTAVNAVIAIIFGVALFRVLEKPFNKLKKL